MLRALRIGGKGKSKNRCRWADCESNGRKRHANVSTTVTTTKYITSEAFYDTQEQRSKYKIRGRRRYGHGGAMKSCCTLQSQTLVTGNSLCTSTHLINVYTPASSILLFALGYR